MNITRLSTLLTFNTVFLLPFCPVAADLPLPAASQESIHNRVDVAAFDKPRANKDDIFLEVRTKAEFRAGCIPGAKTARRIRDV